MTSPHTLSSALSASALSRMIGVAAVLAVLWAAVMWAVAVP